MSEEQKSIYLTEHLGIEFLDAPKGQALARMEVKPCVCQPLGFLSGGASLALAESLAGYASLAYCDKDTFPFGMQVSANHVHSARQGQTVTATAEAIHIGKSIHLWNITITDENGKIISTARVTNYIQRKQ